MSSDGDWGQANSDAAREGGDKWQRLPRLHDADSPALDGFLRSKNLTKDDLERVGARWHPPSEVCYFFPNGLKYRDVADGTRRTQHGVEWSHLKPVKRTGVGPCQGIIIAEGETDAAALVRDFKNYDVGILPAGARTFTTGMKRQIENYDRILVALDADEAGDKGAKAIMDMLPAARRMRPPEGKDWCDWLGQAESIPDDPWELAEAPKQYVFSARELLGADLGTYKDAHYFEVPILPVRGLMVVHGAMKSLKSFLVDDLCRALATGTDFAGAYAYQHPTPAKVLLIQYEIPPWDFQQRVAGIASEVEEPYKELFLDNMKYVGLADNTVPRLRIGPGLVDILRARAAEADADVVVIDPIQRMLGQASADKADEVDPLMDAMSELQGDGYTVVYTHHNNKSGGRKSKDPLSMTGSQRFGADVDSIASIWHGEGCIDDDNPHAIKQRNLNWTLRNGVAKGRSITVKPNPRNSDLAIVSFDDVIHVEEDDEVTSATDF